jgi:hypothetical protein
MRRCDGHPTRRTFAYANCTGITHANRDRTRASIAHANRDCQRRRRRWGRARAHIDTLSNPDRHPNITARSAGCTACNSNYHAIAYRHRNFGSAHWRPD